MGGLPYFDHGADPQVVSCGIASGGSVDGVSRSEIVSRSKEFAHTVKGFVKARHCLDPVFAVR